MFNFGFPCSSIISPRNLVSDTSSFEFFTVYFNVNQDIVKLFLFVNNMECLNSFPFSIPIELYERHTRL